MIHTFRCVFGITVEIELGCRFGDRVEIEALEFIGGAPIEWRIDAGEWLPGIVASRSEHLNTFHDLQMPFRGGTRGIPAANLFLHTRGIGDAKVMVWLREGTYSERKPAGDVLPILQPNTADSGCA